MDDEYADFPTKVFIDSNVVLEALPLKDLPWKDIDPVGPILLLLTPTLLREVDSKKRDGRLAVRARDFNRLVAPLATLGQPINLTAGTPRVDIVIARCRRIDWDAYDDLDSTQGDSCLIAEVLNVLGVPDKQRLVVSQDINPLIMAKRHGLRTHHISEHWLPLPETSPQEREIAKLKRQLADYAKTEPTFDIKFETPPGPVTLYQVEMLSEGEISALVEAILTANPKQVQRQDALGLMQYDSSLDTRYLEYSEKIVPNFARNYHRTLELRFNQIPFRLVVENAGKIRADHMSIDAQMVGGWFNSRPIVGGAFPAAPRAKNPLLFTDFRPPNLRPLAAVGRHEIEVNRPKRSDRFSAQCEDFRHGQMWEFSGVLWIDPNQEREVVIIVNATAANLHGKFYKTFKLNKSVLRRRAFDLVDHANGRPLSACYIDPLVQKALANKEYDALELDRLADDH